ncbi:hypothetical protein [Flavobacterium sp. ASW18X]|uniref:hypothetical protein n=1 Tax=Flavobacterium sp. ASW18X TaxID=2572595 RepID=UPI0010ADB926|nr:hypothetical protein [Flavobacterium sp. ASW18X]TKD65545.1 hypothetical protein FBT53_05355 [Flavobacterium sp. ASW18X]
MGFLGLAVTTYSLGAGEVETGDVGGKFLNSIKYFMYAPCLLAFPSLLNYKYANGRWVYLYIIFIVLLGIASNSREGIIKPLGVLGLLFVLYLITEKVSLKAIFPIHKIIAYGFGIYLLLQVFSNISLAILYNRQFRESVSRQELFVKTWETLIDSQKMERLRETKERAQEQLLSYQDGWTENYLDNFMLNRYANMRITDQTLYYANQRGYGNIFMQENLYQKLLALFPNPFLRFVNIDLDKDALRFSRGDLLYGKGLGGYRVTSHLGDGLATFGYWYFPIQFITLFFVFKLTNWFSYYKKETIIYAPFALMSIFGFLGFYRNAGGIIADFGYLLRDYVQDLFTYLVVFYFINMLLRLFRRN